MPSTCPHNMANFGALAAEIDWRVWAPQQISTGFTYWLHYCSDVFQRKSTKLRTMFAVSWAGTLYIHFRELLPLDGILLRAKFTLRPSLAFSYISSVNARHSCTGRQPNFTAWYKEWNYGTLAEGATYIRLGGHHVGHWPTF